jgi:transcriptional regulator with XRE-family HTH domain
MTPRQRARGNGRVASVGRAPDWVDFGHFLIEQREALGLRRREAAKRARMPEAEWKALELGYRDEFGGVRVLPNPGPELLARVAHALELPVEELTGRIGPHPEPPATGADDSVADAETTALARRIARLPVEDQRLIAALLDRLLHGS